MWSSSVLVALPYVNWTLLVALSVGSISLAVVLLHTSDVTRGYVAFVATTAALLALLALALDGSLPDPAQLVIRAMPPLNGLRRIGLSAFAILTLALAIAELRGRDVRRLGVTCIGVGVAVLGVAAFGWTQSALDGVPLFVQLLALSAVTGSALGSVILGHWYLVTPRLSTLPLVQATRLLTVAVAIQLLLSATWQIVGGAWGPSFSALTGPAALFVWLRLTVGVAFPLVLSYLAHRTATSRSMESATGLLYLDLAAVLGSTIVAGVLYFTLGLLV